MQADLPLSDQNQSLGAFQNSFTPRVLPGRVILGSAIACVLLAVIQVITAINKALSPPSTVLSDRFRRDAILIAAILAGVFFLLAITLSALYYTHSKHRVDVYEEGLVIFTWRGSTAFSWDEIMEMKAEPIYGGSRRVVNWNITLTRSDGQTAQLRGLDGLMTLAKHIERKAVQIQ